ncbi:oxidoreductase-like protein [Xylona heveae TC161]|uniref:Oxidoreductase-like protein n=1 Tax=Xylona heveae (strain CBS 132557 / TC161) TaxID=1328760 RepID=A0A165JSU6_XYLHT|nr:oxidoreductase-like protein [Xylona heveae TC161]KZF26578.1 oxidoreductase-like protein [Xylona heveae TC161]
MSGAAAVELPIIDLSKPSAEVGEEIVNAAATYGFLYIKNTGRDIKPEAIERAFELSREFFASPEEEKAKCLIGPENKGWSSMHREILDQGNQRKGDFKEAFNFGTFENGKARQPLPKSLASHESELSQFATSCHDLCMKVLRAFAIGFKIKEEDGGEEWFSSRHDVEKSSSIFRMLYYPAVPEEADYIPDVDIRAGAHSDYGSITLLFQRPGQPGLEIKTPSDEWASVPVIPNGTESDPSPPILVNIGDLLSYWTDGLLKSTVHRVIFPSDARRGGEDRYSIAYFLHPCPEVNLVPIPSEVVASRGKGEGITQSKRVLTGQQHLDERLAASYGWKSEDKKA